MKKFPALLASLCLVVGLTACATGSSGSSSQTSSGSASSAATEVVAESTEAATVELPSKIEVQVPAKAGGGTDVAARALTQYINQNSDSNLTVVNNTDGSGVVAFETVRTGKADGSEILFFHTTMCIKTATGIYDKSADKDFKVIGVATPTEPGGYVLVVPTSSGITTVDEFIDAASATTYKIGVETGGSSHIMSGMMASELGIELNYVEAGSDTDKLTQLVGGSIDCALVNANQAEQYIQANKVNALACFSATEEGGRNTVLPDVPSFKEEGYDLVYGTYFFILANPEMDDATAEAVLALFNAAASDEATNEILTSSGFGMNFVPYEEAQPLLAEQQASLDAACAELGLAAQ